MRRAQGQSLVLVALSLPVLVGLLLAFINGSALYLARVAMERAVEDATVAGLRRGAAGVSGFDSVAAEAEARRVLRVELGNARGLQDVSTVASEARITLTGVSIQVHVQGAVCLPVWPRCPLLTVLHTANLDAERTYPGRPTPVPPFEIPAPVPPFEIPGP